MKCHHYGREVPAPMVYRRSMSLKIRAFREAKGWSQGHLADVAGMSRSHLAMIEKGRRRPNTDRLDAIARALGVPTELLFDGTNSEARVIQLMRALSAEDRDVLVRMAEALAAKPSKE